MIASITFFVPVILLMSIWRIRRKKLAAYTSDILGLIEVWEKYDGEKILTINKYPHGISVVKNSVKKSYWYYIAQEVLLHVNNKENPQVLFFGLGANTSSYIISQENPEVHQTILEIDNYIIQACRDFFELDTMKNTTVIQGDAYQLVDVRKDFIHKFDVMVVDIFTGIPPYVSTTTNQPPFIKKIIKWGKKDGRIIFNRPANIESDRKDTRVLFLYLQMLFHQVNMKYIKDPRGYKNDIITATGVKR